MKIILDAGCMGEKEETHAYLREKLALPEYYGNNLDALYDCLTELTDTEIVFMNTDVAGRYFKQVYRVFIRAGKENSELRIG